MITKAEIIKVITDAGLDRANRDLDTGKVNWEFVIEDVNYYFRDELAESDEFAAELAGEIFSFCKEYYKQEYVS